MTTDETIDTLPPEETAGQDPVPEEAQSPAPEETGAPAADDADALRRELDFARERVTQLERERILLSQGVPEDDLDYYVFKIGKLVSGEKDFGTAAKEYLKRQGARHGGIAALSTGASLSGQPTRPQTASETMNKLLRGM